MAHATETKSRPPRLMGMNHVALEVGDVDAALAFYGRIFTFTLRGRNEHQAFIDMGDQFVALMQTEAPHLDAARHVGLVVDDRTAVRDLVQAAGGRLVDGPFLDFLDPWGNRIEVVDYRQVQFTKAPQVLRGMGISATKSVKALRDSPTREWRRTRAKPCPTPPVVAASAGTPATRRGLAVLQQTQRERKGARQV